jgi:Amt family ammonium transporter
MICTALFSTTSVNPAGAQGAFYGNPMLLGKTLLVLVIIVPWFCVATWGCLWVADKIMSLRVSGECCAMPLWTTLC